MIGVYRLTREWSTYGWLCPRHVVERKAERWTCERIGEVDGACQDCEIERQAAPGYVTPTITPALLASDRKHVPAKGAAETIGRSNKTHKPNPTRQANQ